LGNGALRGGSCGGHPVGKPCAQRNRLLTSINDSPLLTNSLPNCLRLHPSYEHEGWSRARESPKYECR
jgi:hypothetical protein